MNMFRWIVINLVTGAVTKFQSEASAQLYAEEFERNYVIAYEG
jgi:hypothetical protein